jgi:hypothetical protein
MDAHQQLAACTTEAGILASPDEEHNYRRVWSRDGVVSALGAIAGGLDSAAIWLEATLRTLAAHQGPVGQLPSNVTLGEAPSVSYGTAAVRVDATTWFMVGVGVLARQGAGRVDEALLRAVARGRQFLRAWEGNERGLLYTPTAGNWADEYPVRGYTLYDNALRVWAEREADALAAGHPGAAAAGLAAEARDLEQPLIDALMQEDPPLAWTDPGGRDAHFCGFGCALAALVDVGGRGAALLDVIERHVRRDLVPAFWPPIASDDPQYAALEALAGYGMRNTPGRYHNGGLWPVVTGWAAAAARRHGRDALADRLASGIAAANAAGAFPEFVDDNDGAGAGTLHMAWSAAAELMATAPREQVATLVSAG